MATGTSGLKGAINSVSNRMVQALADESGAIGVGSNVSKSGADNIATFQKYKQALITEDALSNSKVIIEGEKLWDKKAIDALTSDNSSISDWAKMSSKYSYETSYGKGQYHYYQNLKTGEISSFDAKFKLTDEKVIPVDTSLNFLK